MQNAYFGLDLSGLAKLGQLFTALFQAFWPILVILFVGSILIMLLGVGYKFGLGSIFGVFDGKTNLVKRNRSKTTFGAIIAVSLLIMIMVSGAPSQGAVQAVHGDGTAGTLEIGVTNILGGTPIVIRMHTLTSSADFKLNWTGSDTGHSFTTGSTQDEHFVTVNIAKPSGSNDVTVYLWPQSTGAALDSLTLYVSDTSIFPDDIIIDIGITIAVVFVIVGAVMMLKKRG